MTASMCNTVMFIMLIQFCFWRSRVKLICHLDFKRTFFYFSAILGKICCCALIIVLLYDLNFHQALTTRHNIEIEIEFSLK